MNALDRLPNKLDFEGANNFRDLGGYVVADNLRIRHGVIHRSDQLGKLTDADQQKLAAIGLRTVIDFRREMERTDSPDRIDDVAIQQIWLPVDAEAADVRSIRRQMEEGKISSSQATQFLIDANRQFVREFSGVFSRYLHLLLDETSYPLVFHCSAGKDRAGFAAALTLFVAGATTDTVMHDYLATNHCTSNYVNGILDGLSDVEGLRVTPEAVQILMQVQPVFLQTALDTIVADYGDVPTYLDRALDFGKKKQQRVCALICESSSASQN